MLIFCCLASAHLAHAQTTNTLVNTLFQDEPDIQAFTGANDSDPNALQVLSDGRLVYFESDSSAGNNAADAIMLFDPARSGYARFNVLASELALGILIGDETPEIYVEDIAVDGQDNIYILAANAYSTLNDHYFVARIPYDGMSFGIPDLIAGTGTAPEAIPQTDGVCSLEFDAAGQRLLLLISENVQEQYLAGIEGIYALPLLPGEVQPVQLLVSREEMLFGLRPAIAQAAADRSTFDDFIVLPDGEIVCIFNARSGTDDGNDNDGDCVLIEPGGGEARPFIDALDLSADVASGFGQTTTWLRFNPQNGNVALLEEFTSFTDRNKLVEYTQDGDFVRVVADYVDLTTNANPSELRVYSHAFDCDNDGIYYVFTGEDNESCQMIAALPEISVQEILDYLLGLVELTKLQRLAADRNADGAVDIADVIMMNGTEE